MRMIIKELGPTRVYRQEVKRSKFWQIWENSFSVDCGPRDLAIFIFGQSSKLRSGPRNSDRRLRVGPQITPRRALFVIGKIDEILSWKYYQKNWPRDALLRQITRIMTFPWAILAQHYELETPVEAVACALRRAC
jgi:hypothetical protein